MGENVTTVSEEVAHDAEVVSPNGEVLVEQVFITFNDLYSIINHLLLYYCLW